MIQESLEKDIKKRLKKYHTIQRSGAFLFGSSAKGSHFHDIDIGIIKGDEKELSALRNEFEESTFPYKVDIIDFSHVSDEFREKVFHDGVVWLTQKKS